MANKKTTRYATSYLSKAMKCHQFVKSHKNRNVLQNSLQKYQNESAQIQIFIVKRTN